MPAIEGRRRGLAGAAVLALVGSSAAAAAAATAADKPNIVWFLTDDQDQMLGGSFPRAAPNGATPMPKTQALMEEQGGMAINFHIHTPICNPSRSELLSGRYFHNIKTVGGPLWSMHVNEMHVNQATFARNLKEQAGYTCGMFGKYMNTMPSQVPVGWDAWMGNGGGNYVAPTFQIKNLDFMVPPMPSDPELHCGLAGAEGGCWQGPDCSDPSAFGCYTTAVVGNVSTAWIRKVAAEKKPFMAYVAPKAAHEPFNPAPWYVDHWDPAWPETEPRPVAYNSSAEARANHAGTVPKQPMMSEEVGKVVTDVFKNRWRTLMSVDDVIADVINLCDSLGLKDSTYFFYSSDHGFQLGEFNIPMDKRHAYDWDTRIHLLARGPGISPGMTWSQPATQVDMAPTFLGLAGLSAPANFDGKSLVPLLVTAQGDDKDRSARVALPASTLAHLEALGDADAYRAAWRDAVFVEYYFVNDNAKCVGDCSGMENLYPNADANCGVLQVGANAECWANGCGPTVPNTPPAGCAPCKMDCYPTESVANNFIALRTMEGSKHGNTLYVEYQSGQQLLSDINFTNVDFIELFDVSEDPWLMHNLYNNTGTSRPVQHRAATLELHTTLHEWFSCAGATCP